MAKYNKLAIESARVSSGPFSLFHNTFVLEFLEIPQDLDATVLMRTTYLGATQSKGKAHPQSPPLHLHFNQAESFYVKSGSVGTTDGWGAKDMVWVGESEIREVEAWVPHRFWPDPEAKEDSVVYLWAHPDGVQDPMDTLFFATLLGYLSDVAEGKVRLNLLQVMLMQHATASALVVFPTAWWLGPLRWWVPWKLQGVAAWVGRRCGYTAVMREYVTEEDWERYVEKKGV